MQVLYVIHNIHKLTHPWKFEIDRSIDLSRENSEKLITNFALHIDAEKSNK